MLLLLLLFFVFVFVFFGAASCPGLSDADWGSCDPMFVQIGGFRSAQLRTVFRLGLPLEGYMDGEDRRAEQLAKLDAWAVQLRPLIENAGSDTVRVGPGTMTSTSISPSVGRSHPPAPSAQCYAAWSTSRCSMRRCVLIGVLSAAVCPIRGCRGWVIGAHHQLRL